MGVEEEAEGRLLNRVVRCTEQGWELEPDERHADLIIQGLEWKGANKVGTLGDHEPRRKDG